MPELPDIELYRGLLSDRLVGKRLVRARLFTPFVLRSVDPPFATLERAELLEVRRLGKRIVLAMTDELFVVIHLMIAGRFRWQEGGTADLKLGGKIAVAAFEFENGVLYITEAGSKKRASIILARGEAALAAQDPGGIDVTSCSLEAFTKILQSESHTVKDSLINPHLFSGIGNAYSDEILHAARMSPMKRTASLTPEEFASLFDVIQSTMALWTEKLKKQFANKFPGAGDVTAFRPDFAVHGKFGQPCPVCGKPIQRIRYADNETNYCAECQNGGRILADRAMSRLLKDDYPRTL